MTHGSAESKTLAELRKRAEDQLDREILDIPDMSPDEFRKLVHELRTHQIELELQNEELRGAQEELVESRNRYSDLYDFAPVAYVTISDKGLILRANLTAAEMLGVERARLVEHHFSAFLVEEDQQIYFVLRRQLLDTRERQTCELRMRKKDGHPFWVKAESTLTEDRETGGLRIRTVLSDITQRKRAEAEAQAAQEKLLAQQRREQQRVEKANRELERRNRDLQDLVHVASHDLRAPLVNIRGFVDVLTSSCQRAQTALATIQDEQSLRAELVPLLDEEIPDSLAYIRTNSTKMNTLLTGLLSLSRIGIAALTIELLDLNQMMAEIVHSLEFSVRQAGATIHVDALPSCLGDKTQIGQVFSNLLDNALKYLEPDRPGIIRISARKEAGQVVYCVEDNGIGIDSGHQETVFKPFHRLESDQGDGLGLGLTIVRRIVGRRGGRIWVESAPNEGSRFYVSLPCE